jgi:hypothetical protein
MRGNETINEGFKGYWAGIPGAVHEMDERTQQMEIQGAKIEVFPGPFAIAEYETTTQETPEQLVAPAQA